MSEAIQEEEEQLRDLVKELQAENAKLKRQAQQERLQWESRSMNQELELERLKLQLQEFPDLQVNYQKTKDQLEASHMELEQLSRLYSEFMEWQHDKLKLQGEKEKLVEQNKTQQQTILTLEKRISRLSASSSSLSPEVAEVDKDNEEEPAALENSTDRNNRYTTDDKEGKTKRSEREQASFIQGAVNEQKNRQFWSWPFLQQNNEEEIDTTDLNALKRLDDQMVRAEQISKSMGALPSLEEDHDDDDENGENPYLSKSVSLPTKSDQALFDNDDDDETRLPSDRNNRMAADKGFGGFFQRGPAVQELEETYRTERFEYSNRDLYNHPRVSEGPQNLQNVLNLM